MKGRPRVFISGQEGMVGSAIFNLLKKKKLNIQNMTDDILKRLKTEMSEDLQ